ncbi:MAG: hypothetical protein US50_C0001G0034 [Candidatus Nomurabacteria bacterium GW2011_GWB1_37_5]|uniref:Uncharacterized protein n=1 Tax=Candidatus Nomurabacteria bacterium GW2011_GWB1_37_5 TaxID=1618742 RepID=A0A0G0H1H0_9BACT|nr:MAG: hypothetical protein US50_C0001G0034 [Candidatus Nomurabacteria bacterium GW2011_GWB1_37_5]
MLEKPIQTIRKAVNLQAEELAKKEFLPTPEPRHFKAVFDQMKEIREYSPKMLEKLIIVAVQMKDIKEEIGPELDAIFSKVFGELSAGINEKLDVGMKQIMETKNITSQTEALQELSSLSKRIMEDVINNVKNDARVVSAFKGKEKLLEKVSNNARIAQADLVDTIEEEV